MAISTVTVGNATVIQGIEGGSISIAVDYTAYYSRIATALESIAVSTKQIETLSTTSGIRVIDPWRYIEIYETVRGLEQESVSLTEIVEKIKRIPKDWNRPVRDWD
jgi:hypothetical protein